MLSMLFVTLLFLLLSPCDDSFCQGIDLLKRNSSSLLGVWRVRRQHDGGVLQLLHLALHAELLPRLPGGELDRHNAHQGRDEVAHARVRERLIPLLQLGLLVVPLTVVTQNQTVHISSERGKTALVLRVTRAVPQLHIDSVIVLPDLAIQLLNAAARSGFVQTVLLAGSCLREQLAKVSLARHGGTDEAYLDVDHLLMTSKDVLQTWTGCFPVEKIFNEPAIKY
mmetsp:Transcript_43830/g.73003  ORF Transcript_43830/g.73003 Transcript_43830/m.73003 type:complete len:224 (-) Transcript_43830:87-758(-)